MNGILNGRILFNHAPSALDELRRDRQAHSSKAAPQIEQKDRRPARRTRKDDGKSWVHHDPLQKIKILSGSRMRELVRVLSEV